MVRDRRRQSQRPSVPPSSPASLAACFLAGVKEAGGRWGREARNGWGRERGEGRKREGEARSDLSLRAAERRKAPPLRWREPPARSRKQRALPSPPRLPCSPADTHNLRINGVRRAVSAALSEAHPCGDCRSNAAPHRCVVLFCFFFPPLPINILIYVFGVAYLRRCVGRSTPPPPSADLPPAWVFPIESVAERQLKTAGREEASSLPSRTQSAGRMRGAPRSFMHIEL